MSKKVNYPKVLDAAMKGESALWEIGDALIEAVGPPSQNGVHDQSYTKLKPIIAELFDHGIEQYDEKHLTACGSQPTPSHPRTGCGECHGRPIMKLATPKT